MDEILRPVAVPVMQQLQRTLQQDSVRPHVARVCWDLLAQLGNPLVDERNNIPMRSVNALVKEE